ncbi:uncharacterized protein LOC144134721 [Amblyomma americanum]
MPAQSFVGMRTVFCAVAFVLNFHAIITAGEAPQLTECTKEGIYDCYTGYDNVFQRPELQRNDEGQFNEEAYREACSGFTETSSCYAGFTHCPESMRSNFTRREGGYRAFRALVCDTEALKVAISAKNCTDPIKMRACMSEHHGNLSGSHARFEEILCRWLKAERVCYDASWTSECPWSLEFTKTFVTRTLDSADVLHDCESMYPQDAESIRNNVAAGGGSDAPTHGHFGGSVAGK